MSLLLGGLTAAAFWIAPARSAADGPITLRVPVELKKMIAEGVSVSCSIWGDDTSQGAYLGKANKVLPIANGEFNQIVELVAQPEPGKSFVAAKTYRCGFNLREKSGGGYPFAPEQGPPGPDLWKKAKPGEFFRWEVTGQLTGVAFGGGPKSLQSK